ncbi:hypothetical protein niasHS_015545 [Heterodera schachtii]|uniref:B30.2/SPRY domain-containing protein n=1 Tax=Heterodera schachtii TaxID=97005 RepID=A0ABD2I705_HETSC
MNNSLKRKMADGQSEEIAGPTETFCDQQQQQQKEFREKFAKMETELKEAKQLCKIKDLENRVLQSELEKQNLMTERNALQAKIDMMEKEKEQQNEQGRYVSIDQMKPIFDRINELEQEQKEQSKATSDQFSQLQNDQKKILVKINEMDKGENQKRTMFLNFRQNYWDANFCHENLKITGDKSLTLTVHYYKGNLLELWLWRSVFAKHSILLNKNSSNIFYYEISVKNEEGLLISFGFAVKKQTELYETIRMRKGTYAYDNDGEFVINGEEKRMNAEYPYGVGDTVGIGVNLITRQIIFTRNGRLLDSSDFFVAPSFADDSFYPFVSLASAGNKIEANFGPNFKFDLATL